MRSIKALAGAAPYFGGKKQLAATIVKRIQKIDHLCYAEPFVGMGGVFFRRTEIPKSEIINDVSRDVATFFRVLQRHYLALVDMMRWQITTRVEFERLCETPPETLTDLERAARFYYLQRIGWAAKLTGRVFVASATQHARFDITRLIPQLEELHTRLAGVVIENRPYAEFIERYDKPTTLFYLDPPYYGHETDYGELAPFERADFQRLATQLARIKGHFILSLNDVPEIRETFGAFEMESVSTFYSANSGKVKRVKELLISNARSTKA